MEALEKRLVAFKAKIDLITKSNGRELCTLAHYGIDKPLQWVRNPC